jgi:hypothetical protein
MSGLDQEILYVNAWATNNRNRVRGEPLLKPIAGSMLRYLLPS